VPQVSRVGMVPTGSKGSMTMTNVGSAMLPAPQVMGWAMFSPYPSSSVLLELGMTEAEVEPIVELEQADRAMREAVDTLTRSMPGGDVWAAAELNDVDNVREGKPTGALAKLIAGHTQRWGEAVARTHVFGQLAEAFAAKPGSSVEVRRRATDAAAKRMTELTVMIEATVVPIWPQRADRAAAWASRNRADELCRGYSTASAVARWATGQRWDSSARAVPGGRAGGYLTALRSELDGQRLLTTDGRLTYPPDLDGEAREPRAGSMLLGGKVLGPAEAARRG